jgi:hypothetical protein
MPNMFARGILFGKMVLELGDNCGARCAAHDLQADIEVRAALDGGGGAAAAACV